MKKPIIVLTPRNKPMEAPFDMVYNFSNGFNFNAISNRGGIPIMAGMLDDAQAEQLMENADGLFLTGGADVDPKLYGEEIMECCGKIEYDRDKSDYALLKAALKFKKPIIGICRGCQIANVYLGGTMYQDIKTQVGDKISHPVYDDHRNETTHSINVVKDTPLYNLFGEESFGVNSLHHQAIKDLAPNVKAMAYAPDGIIESWYLESNDQWIRAYQWHPEMQQDNSHNLRIFEDFINACLK